MVIGNAWLDFHENSECELEFSGFCDKRNGAVSGDSNNFDRLELKKTLEVESEGLGFYLCI
jgi:hypothetical protein